MILSVEWIILKFSNKTGKGEKKHPTKAFSFGFSSASCEGVFQNTWVIFWGHQCAHKIPQIIHIQQQLDKTDDPYTIFGVDDVGLIQSYAQQFWDSKPNSACKHPSVRLQLPKLPLATLCGSFWTTALSWQHSDTWELQHGTIMWTPGLAILEGPVPVRGWHSHRILKLSVKRWETKQGATLHTLEPGSRLKFQLSADMRDQLPYSRTKDSKWPYNIIF